MKRLIRLSFLASVFTQFCFVANLRAQEKAQCDLVRELGAAQRYDCEMNNKNFHVLKLKGTYAQSLSQHALLMPNEIVAGPVHEVIDELNAGMSQGSFAARSLKSAIFQCYLGRIRESVSREFLEAGDQFARVLSQRLGTRSKYTETDFRNAIYGIEMSIAFEGLFRRLEQDKIGVIAELGATCGIQLSLDAVSEILGSLGDLGKMKMGCLGFTSPSNLNREGSLMHARNFDANLVASWNKHPTLFLIEEPGYYRYAAVASAGVIYPGGISGMNEHGISTSIHEMSTTKYRTYHYGRNAALAPFIQQRILRETSSIDEAIKLVERTKHFGGWTILVSDSKTNETASIEISGDRVQVARRKLQLPMGQANHFVGSKMGDQFFTYSFGKKLESQSRLSVIERSLRDAEASVDLAWMIDHLSGHQDAFEGLRAFGRTAVKAYNVMSTIAMPERREFWFTIGDQLPAAHGHFVGVQIDFERMEFNLVGALRTQQFSSIPNWEQSLSRYVDSRLRYEAKDYIGSLEKLDEAISLAELDGIDESTYKYIRARLLLEMNRPKEALSEFNRLWAKQSELHRHKVALIALFSAAAIRGLPPNPQQALRPVINDRAEFAINTLRSIKQNDAHFDLDVKLSLANNLKRGRSVNLPKIDFVTVE